MSRTAHRATWPALLLTIIISLIVSAPAHAARSTGDPGGTGGTGGERIWRPLVCTYTDEEVKAEAETVKSEAGVLTLDSHIICWLAAESTPTNPVEQAIIDAFLARTGLALDAAREHQLGAILCQDGSVGMTMPGGRLPTVDDARKACDQPVVPGGGGGGDGGKGGILPGLLGSASGMPSSESISCSAQGAANPYAQEAPKEPRVSDGDIATGLIGSWLTGVAVIYGTAKGAGAAPTVAGSGLAAGAGTVGVVAWGTTAANVLGNLMDGRYRDAAESLAKDADHFALAAEANAQAAQQAATASGSAGAQAAADQARAAADAAAKAAAAARKAAEQAAAAKTRAEVAAAYDAAKKADAEAKKKAEEAAKAREDAQKKASAAGTPGSTPAPTGGTGTGSGTSGTPAGQSAESTCEKVRRQVWECEQGGWKSFSCQELARMLQGCRMDMTVALVDGDSAVCGLPTVSTEELVRARDQACGLLVGHPMPGVDPCTRVVEGTPEIRGECDPTIAYGGCPDEPDVVVGEDDTVCFPAPPGAPPMPCVDPTPGGGPIIGGFLQDPLGAVLLVGPGGVVLLGQGYPPRL
ncbi:MAG: hypothetical protein IPF90_04335 [Actinomycetales bacterium]|nr:hypothetical protein [Candidatus Phosphoribacter baldrii]